MRKPSLPRAAPWQLPVLQPALMNTGITSSRKLSGGCTAACETLTGTVDRLAAIGDGKRGRAVSRRVKDRPDSLQQLGVARRDRGLLGDVAGDAVGKRRLDHDRLPVARGRQLNFRRENLDLGQRRPLLGRENLLGQIDGRRRAGVSLTGPDKREQAEEATPDDRRRQMNSLRPGP